MAKLNMDLVRSKQKEIQDRNESDFHELKANQWEWFFIMPPFSDAGVPWAEVERHGYHVCPKRKGIRECLMCKEIRVRAKRGDSEFVDKWKLQPAAYLNAIRKSDVRSGDPEKIKVLKLTPRLFSDLVDHIVDEDVDITDVTAAVPIGIKKTQKGTSWQTIRYKDMKFGEPVDISRYITDAVLEEGLFELDAMNATQAASDKDLRKAIRGDKDDDGDDDFDDTDDFEDDAYGGPPPKTGKEKPKKAGKKSKDLDDDLDDDFEDDFDDGPGDSNELEDDDFEDDLLKEPGDELDDLGDELDLDDIDPEPPPPPAKKEPPKRKRTKKETQLTAPAPKQEPKQQKLALDDEPTPTKRRRRSTK